MLFLQRVIASLVLSSIASGLLADGVSQADQTPGEKAIHERLSADSFDITTLRLWPGKAPDEPRPIGDEAVGTTPRGNQQIRNVSQPSITVARPKGPRDPMPAILVCPGGGYGVLGVDQGGVDVIEWLRPLGVAGVYMKYRVPKRHRGFEMHHHATQDIQRAIRLLRSRAGELGIDPRRIGVIGFSAGGHLTAMASTNHRPEHRLYEAIDAIDKESGRPDFVAMVAPAYLTMPIPSSDLDPNLRLDSISIRETPPTFITSAVTDKFTIGSLHYALHLRERRVPVELHIYEKGGHAEGIHEGTDNQWPRMFRDWLERRGIIEADAKP